MRHVVVVIHVQLAMPICLVVARTLNNTQHHRCYNIWYQTSGRIRVVMKESTDSSQNAPTSGTAKEGQSLLTSLMC